MLLDRVIALTINSIDVVLFEARKAMYGMDDAARKSFELLTKNLASRGHVSTERNPTLFKHVTGPIL